MKNLHTQNTESKGRIVDIRVTDDEFYASRRFWVLNEQSETEIINYSRIMTVIMK